jgi:predicted XRE-type DNA-binding protein
MIIDDGEKRYVVSSSNLFADVGLPDAEECFVRSRLLIYLVKEIERRNLSHHQASAVLDVPESDISLLLDCRLTSFSLERLIEMVAKLGMDVAISCQPAEGGGHGHVTISLPHEDGSILVL